MNQPPPRLLLGTNNPGKVREFRRLLDGSGFDLVTPADLDISLEVDETGTTYSENASLKAVAFARTANCIALADDSGIEVDALNGKPGVYSARYGGPGLDDAARTALLVQELTGIADEHRTARYRAVVAVALPTGEVRLFEGVQEGRIGYEPRGQRGFGYDPVFMVNGRTQAELTDAQKDLISHRGQAVRAAREYLRSLLPS